jgi:DNA (cytosine-5)-methyltransferase 1
VDIVVGSPPCTDFSFSNRGGAGDISHGLEHVIKFLKVVKHIRPKSWAMENVPRLATILFDNGDTYPELEPYRDLLREADMIIVDASDYGLPQRRQRCIIGKFSFELLKSYKKRCQLKTLGQVIGSLNETVVKDMNYGIKLPRALLVDHQKEPYLDWEEIRMNREAKEYHPVYNRMSFPDQLDRPVRTVTATCTRVSRESIVVQDADKDKESVRRLTIRERACLQGFPITYQFSGGIGEKMRLVGNAMPPVLSYYIAHAMRGTTAKRIKPLSAVEPLPFSELRPSAYHPVETNGYRYRADRRFRFAVPGLRFGSGMRFDLTNKANRLGVSWTVEFFFGPSKDIRTIKIDRELISRIQKRKKLLAAWLRTKAQLAKSKKAFSRFNSGEMQRHWAEKVRNGQHPFKVIDIIGEEAQSLSRRLGKVDQSALSDFVVEAAAPKSNRKSTVSADKLRKHALKIFCGLLVAYQFNCTLKRSPLPKTKVRSRGRSRLRNG